MSVVVVVVGYVGAGIEMGVGIERSDVAVAASIGEYWYGELREVIVEVEEGVGPILGKVGDTRTANSEPRLLSSRRDWMDGVALGPGAFVNVQSVWETERGGSADGVVANMAECS